MSDMNVVVGGKDNNKYKLPRPKKVISLKRVFLYFFIFCAVVATITIYAYFNKPSSPAPASNGTSSQLTPAEIKRAQTEIVAEGVVTALTGPTVTMKVSSTGEQLTLFIMPKTTFSKGWQYEPTDRNGLVVGELIQVVYDKSTMRVVQIAYGLKT